MLLQLVVYQLSTLCAQAVGTWCKKIYQAMIQRSSEGRKQVVFRVQTCMGGRGTQIQFWMGVCRSSFKTHTHVKGSFRQKKYPFFDIFSKYRPILCKHPKILEILEKQPHVLGYFCRKWDPCGRISCEKATHQSSTSPYPLRCKLGSVIIIGKGLDKLLLECLVVFFLN